MNRASHGVVDSATLFPGAGECVGGDAVKAQPSKCRLWVKNVDGCDRNRYTRLFILKESDMKLVNQIATVVLLASVCNGQPVRGPNLRVAPADISIIPLYYDVTDYYDDTQSEWSLFRTRWIPRRPTAGV
jgi:hypothetical protein